METEFLGSTRGSVEPHKGDKRYVRRDEQGHFTKSQDNVSRSLSADRRRKAKTVTPKARATEAIRSVVTLSRESSKNLTSGFVCSCCKQR
jgi:hypothetical protein